MCGKKKRENEREIIFVWYIGYFDRKSNLTAVSTIGLLKRGFASEISTRARIREAVSYKGEDGDEFYGQITETDREHQQQKYNNNNKYTKMCITLIILADRK